MKSVGNVKNRMLKIDVAQIKENIDKGVVKAVKWINSKEQLADSLTKQFKQKVNYRRGVGSEGGEERGRESELELVCSVAGGYFTS